MGNEYEPNQERFNKDISAHRMEVLMDNGVYRHLRFKKPESGDRHFNIVTTPGHLFYYGDMGAFCFARVHDMLCFFRNANINPGYWAEKIEAADKLDGYEEYDEDAAREHVKETLDELELDAEQREEAEDQFDYDSEEVFRQCLNDFELDELHNPFQDSWECSFKKFTGRYIWACRAIVWAVAQYDQHKAALEAAGKEG